jgi:photosystem II stability/assembly factor-like uncharacterized protein
MFHRLVTFLILIAALCAVTFAGEWTWLGPEGGDARSLAYDPQNPDHIFLGTMAGKLFTSSDGGAHWTRVTRLGGDDYVLDSIAVDPSDPQRIYVAAWSVNDDSGDLFRSTDGGKTWAPLAGMHGKSLHALALAASNPKEVVTVALDGVYRSLDAGDTWQQISPPHHAEIKNLQSVAIDPKDPDVIYVGTWHLPWKTADGGKTWTSIKKGVIDDSDVFSIIINPTQPQNVFVSACSGIYKSEDGAALFHKVQGMPFSARRTRALSMDPSNPSVVYAGTTEGLWKSEDAGHGFHLMSSPAVVVNSILIDPRKPSHLLLATDRGGILVSDDGGHSFTASNRGFSHRQVTAVLVDRNDSSTLYAGMLNDKEYGGVFVSRDSGLHWQQMSAGLEGRDVFTLRQTSTGALIAGTNRGIFEWKPTGYRWEPINSVLTEKEVPVRTAAHSRLKKAAVRHVISRSELETQVNDLSVADATWYAATPYGLYTSENRGETWRGGAVAGLSDFVGVKTDGQLIAAASHSGLALSLDGGNRWYAANLPAYVTHIHGVALGPEGSLWIASRQGLFRSTDNGDNWDHILSGLPAMHISSVTYDAESNRLFATSSVSAALYESADGGHHWRQSGDPGWEVRAVAPSHGHLFLTTAYDGVLTDAETARAAATVSGESNASQ